MKCPYAKAQPGSREVAGKRGVSIAALADREEYDIVY
jgi:hypothetical protein